MEENPPLLFVQEILLPPPCQQSLRGDERTTVVVRRDVGRGWRLEGGFRGIFFNHEYIWTDFMFHCNENPNVGRDQCSEMRAGGFKNQSTFPVIVQTIFSPFLRAENERKTKRVPISRLTLTLNLSLTPALNPYSESKP